MTNNIFNIITSMPAMYSALRHGVIGRAIEQNIVNLNIIDLSSYSNSSFRGFVDDRPYGGGPGMVMKYEPLQKAIHALKQQEHATNSIKSLVIHFSPQGELLTQEKIQYLAKHKKFILLASRYEGVDQRLLDSEIDLEYSLGDYVISGGDLAVMVFIDALTRLQPNVLGCKESASEDSFSNGLLDYPHYTRPEVIDNQAVPDVLLSGNHAEISRWRLKQSLGRTWLLRPDLINKYKLNREDKELLNEFICEL